MAYDQLLARTYSAASLRAWHGSYAGRGMHENLRHRLPVSIVISVVLSVILTVILNLVI